MLLIESIQNKSIFSLFSDEFIETINLSQYIKKIPKQTCLISKNGQLKQLIIPLDQDLYIYDSLENDPSREIGKINIGRSVNLYSILHNTPFQFSIYSKTETEILEIPQFIFENWLEKNPHIKNYLLKVTENHIFQQLVKSLQNINLSQNFIIEFINLLEYSTLQAHTNIIDKSINYVYYIIEGKSLTRYNQNTKTTWLTPLRTWLGLNEFLQNTLPQFIVSSSTTCTCLKISHTNLNSLKSEHPEEFINLTRFLKSENTSYLQNENQEDQEVDIEKLFLENESKYTKSNFQAKYPWVSQNEQMDCGPACLSMICQYFGKNLSLQFWRSKLSTDKEGTTLFDLALTTQNTGFISHCLEVDDIRELDDFLFPFITLRNYHYLVVYEIRKNSVIVGDPAIGIRELSYDEFNDGFEKVGLFLKPNLNFNEIPESPSKWSHYKYLFNGFKTDFTFLFICSLLGVLFSLSLPIITQLFFDYVLIEKDYKLFWILSGSAFIIYSLLSFTNWAEKYYQIFIMNKFNFRAKSLFFDKMLSLPYNFYSTRHVGDFTHRFAEIDFLRSFFTNTLFGILINLISISFFTLALFAINFKIAAVVTILIPLLFIVPLLFTKKLNRQYNEIFNKLSSQSGFISDIVKGITTIKALGAELTTRMRFENKLASLVKEQNKFSTESSYIETFILSYHRYLQLFVLTCSIYLGLNNEISPGQVISISLITNQIFQPILFLAKQWEPLIHINSTLNRLNDIFLSLSEDATKVDSFLAENTKKIKGEIEFKDVWFRYGGESTDWILKGLNFKIEHGQKVAIVGPSGSGKSTLALLLTRMFEPTKGQILIDGVDYREFNKINLRKQIGLLNQETCLFEGTIAENIAFNDIEINRQKLIHSVELSNLETLFQTKTNGLAYKIPSGGLGVSGGEKQKISLARLFYQTPQIAILDEATSALDGVSENEILTQIKTELSQKTIINIAHRYSTVKASDFCLILNEGKVVDYGSIDYLEKENSFFQKLFNLSHFANKNEKDKAV